jgi:hypothetical protein
MLSAKYLIDGRKGVSTLFRALPVHQAGMHWKRVLTPFRFRHSRAGGNPALKEKAIFKPN